MFPTTSHIFNNYLPHLFALFLALVMGGGLLIRYIRGRRAATREERTNAGNWAFIGVAVVIALVVSYFSLPPLVNAFRYRFDPQQIVEIRVIKLGNETKRDGTKWEPVIINNRELIAKGFQTLTTAKGYNINHERFQPDGYGIDFKLEGSSDYSPMHLTAYRSSRQAGASTVNTPVSVVAVSSYLGAADLNFSCVAFHNWLRRNVDPLFVQPPVNLP